MLCLTAGAQVQLYVCHDDRCEVYDTEHIDSIIFHFDSFRIDGQQPYYAAQVDSIVLKHPSGLTMEERGWWGDMSDAESRFLTVLTIENGGFHFDYHVRFTFTANGNTCQTAVCELTFYERWQVEKFLYNEENEECSSGDNPYIYVKESLTGPRRFETWKMGDPVLPEGCSWEVSADSLALYSDCSPVLVGRPMNEVKQIVEAWLFQPSVRIDDP